MRPRRWRRAARPIRSARSPRCSRPAAPLSAACRYCYELRLHRARGYGALKAILDVLAEEEPLTLTEIALRLRRTPGSTKDYLSWLEDVDLITSRQKRYSFSDPLMRLWVRLHCRPMPPSDEDIAREVHGYVMGRLPPPNRRSPWPARPAPRPARRAGASSRSIEDGRSPSFVASRTPIAVALAFAAACAASFLLDPPPAPAAPRSPSPRPRTAAGAAGRSRRPADTRAVPARVTAAIPAAPTCSLR